MKDTYRIYTDGGNSTEFFRVAWVNASLKTYYCNVIQEKTTNNVAEYLAVIEALKAYPVQDIEIVSDSQLIVNQCQKKWSINHQHLRILRDQVLTLCKGRNVTFTWVRRHDNLAGILLEWMLMGVKPQRFEDMYQMTLFTT